MPHKGRHSRFIRVYEVTRQFFFKPAQMSAAIAVSIPHVNMLC
jgi:hypothetical protein